MKLQESLSSTNAGFNRCLVLNQRKPHPYVIACCFALAPVAAAADQTFEPMSGVTIENAVASPAAKGNNSAIRFRIVNTGVDDLALIGIRSPQARSGALAMADPVIGSLEISTLTIEAEEEEEADLSTSHLRAEIRGLRRSLESGDYVRFELVFRNGALPGEAHVHGK